MGFLTAGLDNTVRLNGQAYRVNPAFDVILEIQNLYNEEQLSDSDKLNQALSMLLCDGGRTNCLPLAERSELLEEIYRHCVNTRKHSPGKKELPVLDFEFDGEYIYASFMMDYGIDLVDMQGKLPWKKFIALFQGLSSKTKIREVMRIRSMDIPTYDGKNGKQIREIQELKSYYALPVNGGGGSGGLDLLFGTLESMARK